MEDDDYPYRDYYNHPAPADAAATIIFEQQKEALKCEIDELKQEIRFTTDPGELASLNVALNNALTLYATTYSERFPEIF